MAWSVDSEIGRTGNGVISGCAQQRHLRGRASVRLTPPGVDHLSDAQVFEAPPHLLGTASEGQDMFGALKRTTGGHRGAARSRERGSFGSSLRSGALHWRSPLLLLWYRWHYIGVLHRHCIGAALAQHW